jgi:hypothetical protein
MKKLLLTICSSLFCVLSYAQTEHLTFKGLPIDGSKQEFVKELQSQGYENAPEMGADDVLSGTFIGRDCYVFIYDTPITNTVWQVGVLFKSTYDTWSLIKRIYDDLVDVYTKKYGAPILDQKEFKSPWREGDGHELFALRSDRCVYRTVFVYIKDRMDIGCVEIRMANDCRIIILYEDSINSDLLTKERANEI